MATEAQIRANMKYNEKNTTQIKFSFNNKTDADVIAKLRSVPNKQGYVKELIRRDINEGGTR
jgi:trehalose/maltose hydrolase-like predicted phosphorylase